MAQFSIGKHQNKCIKRPNSLWVLDEVYRYDAAQRGATRRNVAHMSGGVQRGATRRNAA
jgi:hypothetical protein